MRSISLSPRELTWRRFKQHRLSWWSLIILILLTFFVFILPPVLEFFLKVNYQSANLDLRFSSISPTHLLGTDELGRDVLARLLYGGRISIGIAIISAIASLLMGALVGAYAGYYGGWIDTLLMRFTDAMLSLPTLPLMILLAAVDLQKVLPSFLSFLNTGLYASFVKLMLIIILFGWMGVARLIRGEFLSLKEREFILASKALGNLNRKIIWGHMLPNCLAPMIVSVTLSIGSIILYEAVLSFIGLGIQPPIPSWGNMLHHALEYIRSAPLLAIYPGLCILMIVVCINFVGDGLRDAFDPRFTLKTEEK